MNNKNIIFGIILIIFASGCGVPQSEYDELKAVNTSERLKFKKEASKQIHDAFMKGGTVKFRITEDDRQTNQYKFDIQKSDYYENAYRKLLENNKS